MFVCARVHALVFVDLLLMFARIGAILLFCCGFRAC